MRRSLAILAALAGVALSACSVDVDGAPCGTAGTTQDCPSGQACGNDGKCSERAAACTSPEARCTPDEKRCGGASGTERVETCSATDPVCGAWVVEKSCGSGLACDTRSGVPDCGCKSFAGPTFEADPADGSGPGALPFATGAPSPSSCRFKRLGDAIARAAQVAGPAAVQVGGGGAQVVFDAASGDGPIAIPANVTVSGATASGTTTILRVGTATTAPIVTLSGRLEGFRIESTGATGAGVAVSCGPSGTPSLARVAVDGGSALTTGIDVSGACGADLATVSVSNVAADAGIAGSGAALYVHADPSAQVTVYGGTFGASDVGARLTGGKVTFGADGDPLASVEIAANAKEGVVASAGAALDARLYLAKVHGNGAAGIAVDRPTAGSTVTLRGCDVYTNGAAALSVNGDASTQVTVYGGALRGSDVGARVTGGKATLGGVDSNGNADPLGSVEIAGNAKEGVVASGGAVDARLFAANVHGNGGTGIVVDQVSTGSAVTVRGCDVYSNGTTGTPRTYGASRSAGGALLVQDSLTSLSWLANRLYANKGDQLAFQSTGAWTFGPSTCGATSNLFACVTQGAFAVGISGGGTVEARSTVWPDPPALYMGPGVSTSLCNDLPGVPATPICTAP